MTHLKTIYLDHNATTPCTSEVLEAMLPYFQTDFGNASSPHAIGRRAANAVAEARGLVAGAIGAASDEMCFTSGATESNNIVLLGLANRPWRRNRIVLTAIEHKSVIEPCKWLSDKGFDVVEIPVTRDGIADVDAARRLIDGNTLLVCVHGANNEIGTLQPVAAIATLAHDRGALVHCDASQMLGKVPLSVDELGIDFASFSAHKVYGPKGVGALFVRGGITKSPIPSLHRGGGQEGRLRPGTLNVPGIVGFGVACQLVQQEITDEIVVLTRLRSAFEHTIEQTLPSTRINGCRVDRLPGTSSVTISGVPATMLMANIPLVCISDGSACSSGAPEPSHVLLALGLSRDDAECTVRVSFGRGNSDAEAEEAAVSIAAAANVVLSKMREGAITIT